MRTPRYRLLGALLLVIAVPMAACAPDRAVEAPRGQVVLYTSIPDAVVERLEGVIERRFPDLEGNYWIPLESEGISLNVVRGRTADIEQLILDELDRGELQADLIWLAEPSPYESFKEMGLLVPLDPPPGAPIPSGYVDSDGYYIGARVIAMVLAWNTALLPEGLSDWPDLLDSGAAAFPAPESGAARATIMALLDAYGSEFFASFARAGGVSVPDNGTARDGVVEGSFEAVTVLDYMAREARAAGSPVDFVYPASGTVLIPSPIAITSSAANPDAAKAVVDFILSQPGQRIMVEIGGFYPVRTDVAPPAGAPPLEEITPLYVDWSAAATEIDPVAELWGELFGPTPDTG